MRDKDEYIIIVGCGRLGGHLASLLSEERKSVVIIDREETAFSKLSEDFSGFTMEADAIEMETLIRARIERADVVVATTDDDNTNIMIAQIAKEIYQVPKVIARLFELAREAVYHEFGIETICPTVLSAEAFRDIISGSDRREQV